MSILSFPSARHATGVILLDRLARLRVDAAQAWHTRRAMNAMAELTDAGLHDIGIARSEIEHAARHGRPRRP